MDWATANGFILPLSKLVIYDSFVQSGHILMEIRNTFSERPPRNGGDEKLWIIFYLRARLIFLQNSKNPYVRKSVYRVKDYQQAINDNNWNMNNPIIVQGFFV
jgi:chitosanase